MRIGELARQLGVSPDTLRFYERSGLLPRPQRGENGYREYGPMELERIRLLLHLRRLGIPLADAARLAGWCQSGHCTEATEALPVMIASKRAALREQITGLEELDARLATLQAHLGLASLPMADAHAAPCCETAAAVLAGIGGVEEVGLGTPVA